MSAALSAALGRAVLGIALVLVALGGAGLAVAADQPHTHQRRPELTARADIRFAPWRAQLGRSLRAAEDGLTELSAVGRDVLARLYDLDVEHVEQPLVRGDALAGAVLGAREELLAIRLEQAGQLADERLGAPNREALAGVDRSIEALGGVPGVWVRVSAAASAVAEMLRALADHDALVFEATTAGREGRWTEAMDRLDQAEAALARAGAIRDRLSSTVDVSTLDELMGRYSGYDEALRTLYTELAEGAAPDSPELAALEGSVERAQAGLPEDDSVLNVIVADALGPSVAEALVAIERTRGLVAETLTGIAEAEAAGP